MMMKRVLFSFVLLSFFSAIYAKDFPSPSSDFVLIGAGTFTMGSPASEDWRGEDEVAQASAYLHFI